MNYKEVPNSHFVLLRCQTSLKTSLIWCRISAQLEPLVAHKVMKLYHTHFNLSLSSFYPTTKKKKKTSHHLSGLMKSQSYGILKMGRNDDSICPSCQTSCSFWGSHEHKNKVMTCMLGPGSGWTTTACLLHQGFEFRHAPN